MAIGHGQNINTLFIMKINSILGKMTGKIGNIVVSSVNGEVIGREYNPNVTNPNTTAQQGTRARFKMASQLSAAMTDVIAIKKDGNVSARNQFAKVNFPSISYADGVASVDLNAIQLTKSNRNFGGFSADRASGSAIAVCLLADASASLSRVVYVVYKKESDGTLTLHDSKVCAVAGDDGKFADALRYSDGALVLYAYGIKDLDSSMSTKFGEMNAPTAENVARLLVSSAENMNSVALTKTAGLTLPAGTNSADSATTSDSIVDGGSTGTQYTITASVNPAAGGTVTGAGTVAAGASVTLACVLNEGYSFGGWYNGDSLLSSNRSYTFTANSDMTLEARVTADNGGGDNGGGNEVD